MRTIGNRMGDFSLHDVVVLGNGGSINSAGSVNVESRAIQLQI